MSPFVTVPPPATGDVLGHKYRIREIIGQGGMGIVFSAVHEVSRKPVAVKWLKPSLVDDKRANQRLIRESQVSARIQHPNIVDVYDVGKHKGCVYLVMEQLRGEPLSALVKRGPLDPEAAIHILMPALRGVAAAHKEGVIHRDLKPENIFLCTGPDGEPRDPKVLDFGIAKLVAPDGDLLQSLTRSGALVGTPSFMSPEQATEPGSVGPRGDQYALGVILYYMLTQTLPFRASRVSQLLVEIVQGTPVSLREERPDVPQGLDAVVMKAIARDPADRFEDVEAFARALEPFALGATFRLEHTGRHRLPVAAEESEPDLAMARTLSFSGTEAMLDETPPHGPAFGSPSLRVPMLSRWPAYLLAATMTVTLGSLLYWMLTAG